MPIEDPKKNTFPGPGQYQTQGKIDKTTFGPRSPAYSMSMAGQIKVTRKAIDKHHSHHHPNKHDETEDPISPFKKK